MGTVVTQWNQGSVLTERANMEHKGQGNIARYTRNITVADQGLMVSRRALCHHRMSWNQQSIVTGQGLMGHRCHWDIASSCGIQHPL